MGTRTLMPFLESFHYRSLGKRLNLVGPALACGGSRKSLVLGGPNIDFFFPLRFLLIDLHFPEAREEVGFPKAGIPQTWKGEIL